MLPECSDEELLAELAVVVSTGWNLPQRAARADSVRHLLLLVDPGRATTFQSAAQQLLMMVEDALRGADDAVLDRDERTGCRILLGVHPSYRAVSSPVTRRQSAAELLVPHWRLLPTPIADPAGSFQRRHQASVLARILEVIRARYGQEDDRDYDVVDVRRWCQVDAHRQMTRSGEAASYRVRRDGLDRLYLTESEPPEGCEAAVIALVADASEAEAVIEDVAPLATQPGVREITLRLPRPYAAGETIKMAWEERWTMSDGAPRQSRQWLAVSAPNDALHIDMEVSFAEDLSRPDVCWWYSRYPDEDINEIGPTALADLIDLESEEVASHRWSSSQTERRIDYGVLWVWLDEPASRERWEAARALLT